jgi:hypothetical protein
MRTILDRPQWKALLLEAGTTTIHRAGVSNKIAVLTPQVAAAVDPEETDIHSAHPDSISSRFSLAPVQKSQTSPNQNYQGVPHEPPNIAACLLHIKRCET